MTMLSLETLGGIHPCPFLAPVGGWQSLGVLWLVNGSLLCHHVAFVSLCVSVSTFLLLFL